MMPRPDVDKTYVKNDDLQVEDLEKMKGYWMIAVFGVDSRDGSVGAGCEHDLLYQPGYGGDQAGILIP